MSLPVRRTFGLRDYGTAKWEGGDPNCDHLGKLVPSRAGFNKRYFGKPSSEGNKQDALHEPMGEICAKCGAVRIDQQIGLEQTPAEYVDDIVQVFREVWRVLRDDGTVWLNLGDSYVSHTGDRDKVGGFQANPDKDRLLAESAMSFNKKSGNLKDKDLIGIPWMVAFALRDDGWYLRQDIIWHKPNPMPESVKDRCTKSHEYIFLLSKSAKYYYDNEAVKEPAVEGTDLGVLRSNKAAYGQGPTDIKTINKRLAICPDSRLGNPSGTRNKRDVWTVPTKPYKGAHYATFPPKLIEPMILAGCPAGGIVLDPFVGSGTTIMVANQLGRRGIGLDLSLKYLQENAKERIATVQPIMFN